MFLFIGLVVLQQMRMNKQARRNDDLFEFGMIFSE